MAMVPEGLVLLTSVAFAVSVVRLGRRKVLVQELPAVETLARVDVVCFDKTGTITEDDPRRAGAGPAAGRGRRRGGAGGARGRRPEPQRDPAGDRRGLAARRLAARGDGAVLLRPQVTKVLSGDHPRTVAAVAGRVGVPGADAPVDARTLPDDPAALGDQLEQRSVFGRVVPRQKRATED